MLEEMNYDRRLFLSNAAMTVAAFGLSKFGSAHAQSANNKPADTTKVRPAKKFSGKYSHRTIKGGIGHNLPQEAPQSFAKAVIEVDGY